MRRSVASAAEVVSVGFPFSAFKILTGLSVAETKSLPLLGIALMTVGGVDLLLNVTNLASLAFVRKRAVGVCLTDILVQSLRRRSPLPSDLGVAFDVFLSFALVAVVVGGGLLASLPKWALSVWNVAVVLNVLGAGVGRLLGSLEHEAQASRE